MAYLYKELPPKMWATICVSAYLVGVVATGAATLPDDIGAWLALSLIYLVVLVPFLGVPISKLIYHRIQLAPDTLRVGRERIPVAELDAASIRAAQGAGAPPLAERVARSVSTNDNGHVDAAVPRVGIGRWKARRSTVVLSPNLLCTQSYLLETRHAPLHRDPGR